jgi:hypothetical protein
VNITSEKKHFIIIPVGMHFKTGAFFHQMNPGMQEIEPERRHQKPDISPKDIQKIRLRILPDPDIISNRLVQQ